MAQQFKKTVKRDVSSFDVFKDKKRFKKWHLNLLATAAAQDVEEILDPNYVPITQEEKYLFTEKQKYMYLVATKILLTNRGVVYVGQHEAEKDAQQIFEKVIDVYLHSRTSNIDASTYLIYITSTKFGATLNSI